MFNGGVNQLTFLHYCLFQGVKWPREITRSSICSPQCCAALKLFVRSKIYIFNIYPKRRGEAVAYERLPQSEVRLCTEICKSRSIIIFYFQPAKFYKLCMITISEPHNLLFYSADCKYTTVIRQRLEMPHLVS